MLNFLPSPIKNSLPFSVLVSIYLKFKINENLLYFASKRGGDVAAAAAVCLKVLHLFIQ